MYIVSHVATTFLFLKAAFLYDFIWSFSCCDTKQVFKARGYWRRHSIVNHWSGCDRHDDDMTGSEAYPRLPWRRIRCSCDECWRLNCVTYANCSRPCCLPNQAPRFQLIVHWANLRTLYLTSVVGRSCSTRSLAASEDHYELTCTWHSQHSHHVQLNGCADIAVPSK